MGTTKLKDENRMYKFRTGWEKDHERWEEVDEQAQCEDCGEINRHCRCTDTADEEPVHKNFQEKHGFDERDRSPEEDEEHKYRDDSDELLDGNLHYEWCRIIPG